jgi:hypothetical protein
MYAHPRSHATRKTKLSFFRQDQCPTRDNERHDHSFDSAERFDPSFAWHSLWPPRSHGRCRFDSNAAWCWSRSERRDPRRAPGRCPQACSCVARSERRDPRRAPGRCPSASPSRGGRSQGRWPPASQGRCPAASQGRWPPASQGLGPRDSCGVLGSHFSRRRHRSSRRQALRDQRQFRSLMREPQPSPFVLSYASRKRSNSLDDYRAGVARVTFHVRLTVKTRLAWVVGVPVTR